MSEPGLFIHHTFISWKDLPAYASEEKAVIFAQQWLSPQIEFEVKTSGSTGEPKTIVLKREQMEASIRGTASLLKPTEKDHIFLPLNPETIGGMMAIARAIEWNISLTISKPEANPMLSLLEKHTYTFCSLVPLQAIDILTDELSKRKLNQFRKILLGGASISENLLTALQSLQPVFYHTYGMTETCSHIAARQLNGENKQDYFYPLPEVNVGLNEEECLWIEAPSALHHPLQTNDIARIHVSGGFEILGRKDRTIISGGIKIQLDEMETLFAPLLENRPFFCFGETDTRFGTRHVLYIEGLPFDTEALMRQLHEIAPPYKAPKAIIFADRFERTLSGKIDRINTSQKWAKTN
ncbi:MAG: AMP-binding protein [Bacteroidota bacterium]|nr:AMP-binding protein [Bacteroidota bacterium]MDX5431199.1 AMP-binding protein [Bacteroidota bacterium]MDX5469938.1 AMP-binding protein [Bacteroidota bacterium]